MKKVVLSLFLIFSFSIYAVYQRLDRFTGQVIYKAPLVIPTQKPAPKPKPTPVVVVRTGLYRDGQYTGNSVDAYYGYVQVRAVISGSKISDVQFLDYPQDRNNSVRISNYSIPILTREAIAAQSANVDVVSGATATSGAFKKSLASALALAKN